ncbi:hypothetical protein FRC04_007287 [Tulasnella sp. 424]|nr:hypothetical protein FRC04_007287 [Tulasnella sp. 424]KAG8976214.1 hypothetical protein FRC05_004464 [Tulasnella sp. 425]
MLKSPAGDVAHPVQGLEEIVKDFRRRLLNLLGFGFREFPSVMVLSVLEAINNATKGSESETPNLAATELNYLLAPLDIRTPESYASNMLDYHFRPHFSGTATEDDRRRGDGGSNLEVPVSQALFVKSVRRICKRLEDVHNNAINATIPRADASIVHNAAQRDEAGANDGAWRPVAESLANEMEEEAQEVTQQLNEKQRELVKTLDISQWVTHPGVLRNPRSGEI